ncbi:MAG: glycosyltransferase, partial [Blastocatellia bacterium]|nr:glycosyltransferase [Blastocatellia bacterium]
TGQQLVDYGSMFRAYDRIVIDQMLQFTEQHRFIPALVSWLGFRVKEIPVTHQPRAEGGSRYRIRPLIEMFLDLITSYSVSPLRVLSLAGFVGAMLGFLATAAFVVYRVIEGSGVSGTVSAFALVFLLLALQLLVVASLGEYVGRIYVETKGRPYFVVGKVTRNR